MGDELVKELVNSAKFRCKECGANTRYGAYGFPLSNGIGAFVNRVPSETGDTIDCYTCGMCEETFNQYTYNENGEFITDETGEITGTDDNKYYEYLEKRIIEVDQIDPVAKLFRNLVKKIEEK